jgi:hypothetical protein
VFALVEDVKWVQAQGTAYEESTWASRLSENAARCDSF